MNGTLKPCGTVAAYQRHIRAGEDPDEACAEASRTYANTRGYGRARSKALTRLTRAFPAEFLKLLNDELAKERAQ